MGYITATIILVFGVINHVKSKKWSSPGAFFCYQWALICYLAALRLFGMYEASIKTWIIIIIGCISYLLGIYMANKVSFSVGKKHQVNNIVNEKESYLVFSKYYWFSAILAYIPEIRNFSKAIGLLRTGISLDTIRHYYFGINDSSLYVRDSGIIVDLMSIFSAIGTIIIVIGIQLFISDPKHNKLKLVASVGIVLFRAISTGGRFDIVYFIIELLVCYSIYRHAGRKYEFKISNKVKRVILVTLLGMVIALIYVSVNRGVVFEEINEKYYRYICGNIVFLDLHITDIDASGIWSLSYASLYGFWNIIFSLLHLLFHVNAPQLYTRTASQVLNAQTWKQIGNNMYTNAFITPFYSPYADFRIIGVIVFMAFIGYFIQKIYRKTEELNSKNIVYYLLMMQIIFKTLHMYPFTSKEYAWIMILMIFNHIASRVKLLGRSA